MFGTKKKLMTAVVMLVISAIMMTSASYAWFTISTNPEINDLKTQVVTNENLEIALAASSTTLPAESTTSDSGNQYTWGNVIDLSTVSAYGNTASDGINKTLRPATLNSSGFQYPSYNSDGRIGSMKSMESYDFGLASDGFGNLVSTTSDGHKIIYGYYVDFWVRTNVGGTLKLDTTGVHRSSSTDSALGLGSYFLSNGTASTKDQVLADNIRVAFKEIASQNAGATTVTASSSTDIVASTTSPAAADSSGNFKSTFTNNSIVTLYANRAKLIRMYVYLEGKNVTNAAASIDGAPIGGSLNIQFGIANVDKSMDVQS